MSNFKYKKLTLSFFILLLLTFILPPQIDDFNNVISSYGFPFSYIDIPTKIHQGEALISTIGINFLSLFLNITILYGFLSIFMNEKHTS